MRIGRNGDIFYFHRTTWDDSIGEALMPWGIYKGYHCSPFLVGKQFDKHAVQISKNHRYLYFYEQVVPEEQFFEILRNSRHIDEVGVVYRTNSKNISSERMVKAFEKWLSYPEVSWSIWERYVISFFRFSQEYGKKIRSQMCSVLTVQIFAELGLIFTEDPYHNTLPQHIVDRIFCQKEEYKRCRIKKKDLWSNSMMKERALKDRSSSG